MKYLSVQEAQEFAGRWLPAWTGNRPEHLVSFYSADTFYLDPAVPQGVQGRSRLLDYFRRLLSRFPDWRWHQLEAIPMEHGFLNRWGATIPVGPQTVEVVGVCLVQLDDDALIRRNEVYFDRSELLQRIEDARGRPDPPSG